MIAIRGATTININSAEEMGVAVNQLFDKAVRLNSLDLTRLCCIIFSCTKDITAANPATILRLSNKKLLSVVPLFCVAEHDCVDSLPLCIRIMILTNEEKDLSEVKHIYLGGAKKLREDLTND